MHFVIQLKAAMFQSKAICIKASDVWIGAGIAMYSLVLTTSLPFTSSFCIYK